MRKKLIILVLVQIIILSVLVGYCISANLRVDTEDQMIFSDATGMSSLAEKEFGNAIQGAEANTGVESEATQATKDITDSTEQSNTELPETECSGANSSVSVVPSEETNETAVPTTEEIEEPTLGENQLPGI